jgi:hypothetical protein
MTYLMVCAIAEPDNYHLRATFGDSAPLADSTFGIFLSNPRWALHQAEKGWFFRLDETESMFYYPVKEKYHEYRN